MGTASSPPPPSRSEPHSSGPSSSLIVTRLKPSRLRRTMCASPIRDVTRQAMPHATHIRVLASTATACASRSWCQRVRQSKADHDRRGQAGASPARYNYCAMNDGLADLLACVAAFGRSLDESFDPARFLAEFSASSQRLVPHDHVFIALPENKG